MKGNRCIVKTFFKKMISIKALISFVILLSGCTQTLPVSTDKTPAPIQTVQKPNSFQYLISSENPQWAPDGKKIVFTRGYKIYIADAEGTNNLLLVDLKKDTPDISLSRPIIPLWSPKGDKIAFIVTQSIIENELYVIKADGSATYRNKDKDFSGKISWFPDGEKLLLSIGGNLGIFDSDGNSFSLLKNEDGNLLTFGYEHVELSPDGTKIFANSSYTDLYIFDLKTQKKNILFNYFNKDFYNRYMSWAPDSKSILFRKITNNGSLSMIYKMNIDGSELIQLSQEGEHVAIPSWSPDGKKIAYSISTLNSNGVSNKLQLKIVNPDGSFIKSYEIPTYIVEKINWSPDCTKIAFNNSIGSYVINTSNNDIIKISDNNQLFLQWSSDSNKIFYGGNINESLVSDFNGSNKINLFLRPFNPLVKQFNIKSPEQSEIDELNKSKIVEANSKFALKIFSEIASQKSNENMFISPLSISLVLSMTYNGAEKNTRDQMMNTLEYQGLSIDNVNKNNNTLLRLLLTDQDIQLSIANAIFYRKGSNFKQDFLYRNKANYFSEIRELDFTEPEALSTINNWVSDNTNDKIPSILDKIDETELMYLINAIYFKGTWTNVFEISETKEEDFILADGTVKKHPMMHQYDVYLHFKDDNVAFIRMPYGNNLRTGMYIFLPKKGMPLDQFSKNLSYEKLDQWLSHSSGEKGYITIPKFRMEYKTDLIQPLKNLGMTDAFQSGKADFSKMTDVKDFFLTKALQKTFVEVNEEGTEASVVTFVGGEVTTSSPPPFNFVVDRPFMTAIVDETTKTILFMGLIYNPE